MKYYEIYLPMPTSINKAKDVQGGYWNPKTRKREGLVYRSKEYQDWIKAAGMAWRDQYSAGISSQFTGRIGVVYVFVWPINDPNGVKSDIGNREKVLSDYIKGKFFEDDKMIDEQRQYRRLWGSKRPYAWVRVYEILDKRYSDPALIFNPG